MPAYTVPLEKVTINLRAGDKNALRRFHASTSYNEVIRKLVANHVDRLNLALPREENGDEDD